MNRPEDWPAPPYDEAVLDHGYVRLVETWGSDERIIEAARMSTSKGFLGWGPVHDKNCATRDPIYRGHPMLPTPEQPACSCEPKPGDEKLMRYLWEHGHHTPFEMAGMLVEVSAPVFVLRQWFTHRTQSRNEQSARYGPLPAVDYVPTVDRLLQEAGRNKQAQGTGEQQLTASGARDWLQALEMLQRKGEVIYQCGLTMGVPKELARLALTVSRYSRMRCSVNLRNWLHFVKLRSDPHAQWEIRQYSDKVAELIARSFPRTWDVAGRKRA